MYVCKVLLGNQEAVAEPQRFYSMCSGWVPMEEPFLPSCLP